MATADTPAAAPAPTPAARGSFFRLPRREFFVGGLAGLLVGKGSDWVQPIEWTQKALPDGTKLSFAQNGEDLVADSLFAGLGVTKPSYLDIGAYDPILSNNTYRMYRQGGRGVLVEPNVGLTDRLKGKRPGDVVLQAGIGFDDTPAADYYVFHAPQLNTFDKEQADKLVATGEVKLIEVVKMPLLNINQVIADHLGGAAPDFLSIDVEGLDLPILKTLDFARYRPKVVCAETLPAGAPVHNPELLALLAANGYVVRGMTFANTLFVDSKQTG